MNAERTAGFTILEVMLVLAVTGLMVIGVLAGSAAQVRQQEYRDSVHALQAEVQNQYTEVHNPTIDRSKADATQTCGIVTPVSRGASLNCFVVGRLLSSNGSGLLTEIPILGAAPSGNSMIAINNDLHTTGPGATANGWHLYLNTSNLEKYTVNWGSSLKVTNSGIGSTDTFNVALIMSPSDGSIRTYTNRQAPISGPPQLYDLLSTGGDTLNLCVVAGTGVIFGDPLAVQIPSDASSAAGITIPSQADGDCHNV